MRVAWWDVNSNGFRRCDSSLNGDHTWEILSDLVDEKMKAA